MKILIVDNHPVISNGCEVLLQDLQHIEVYAAESVGDGARTYAEIDPDVAVIDVNLPDGSGYELTRELLNIDPAAKILIFTMCDGAIHAAHAFEAGAMGYISKNSDPMELRQAILDVADGKSFVPEELAHGVAALKASRPGGDLTERDKRILRLLADGATVADAASELSLAYKTVLRACARMRETLDAANQIDLIQKALRLNLI